MPFGELFACTAFHCKENFNIAAFMLFPISRQIGLVSIH